MKPSSNPEAPALTEGQLWDAIQSLRDGMIVYDRDERVVFHNRRLIELYPVLERLLPLPGRSMAELFECVSAMVAGDHVRDEAGALLAQRRAEWPAPAGSPYTITLVDGRRILAGERSTMDGGKVVIHTDVTAEARAEQRLVEAIESLHNGFILFDADDRVLLANEQIRSMFPGQRGAMVPGTHIHDVIEAGIRNGDYRNFGDMGAGEYAAILRRHREGVFDGVERQLADGRWIVIHQAVTPSGLRVGLRTDVTELKQRERELAAAHADLQRQTAELRQMADELAEARARAEAADRAKTEFLAVVGHELRTPFTGIRGMADLLADAPLGAEHRRYLEAMRRSTGSLLGMLDRIIDFSQGELGHIERHDSVFEPALLASESAALFQALALERGLALAVACDTGLPERLVGDEGKTRQILLNLVSNAVKFTDAGSVEISVSAAPQDAGVALRYEVRDTGIGMTPEAVGRLFEPFRMIDGRRRLRGGSGLGLAISKRLAEALGGSMGVSSQPGVGTRFWFTVFAQAAGAPPRSPDGSLPDGTAAGRAILLAEDDPTSRLLLATLLGQWGYVVVEAADGQAALAALAGQVFAAVVMDVNMPVMDGVDAVGRLRAGDGPNRNVPVIGLTADGGLAAREAAGFSLMMAKPFDIGQLRAAVDRAVVDRAVRDA